MALNDVPTSGQTLGGTQNPIRQNFLTINTAFAVDHAVYGDSLQGEHNKVTLTVQAASPLPTIASNQFVVYNTVPNTGSNAAYPVTLATDEICILRQSTSKSIPITAAAANAAGWTYLPSGILMKWGTTGTISNGATITFPTGAAIPIFQSAPFNIQLTIRTSNFGNVVTLYVNSSTAANFVVGIFNQFAAGTDASLSWLAIGN